jgi:MFS family permease
VAWSESQTVPAAAANFTTIPAVPSIPSVRGAHDTDEGNERDVGGRDRLPDARRGRDERAVRAVPRGGLGESPAWAGPVEGAQTVAMIVASGLLAALAKRLRVSRIMVRGKAGIAMLTSALSLAGNVWVVMAILFGVGLAVIPVQAATVTPLQRSTTDGVRGRVSAAFNAALSMTSIASMAAAGILADVVGMRMVFLAGGAIVGVGVLVAWILFRGAPEEELEPQSRAAASAAPAGVRSIATAGGAGRRRPGPGLGSGLVIRGRRSAMSPAADGSRYDARHWPTVIERVPITER